MPLAFQDAAIRISYREVKWNHEQLELMSGMGINQNTVVLVQWFEW